MRKLQMSVNGRLESIFSQQMSQATTLVCLAVVAVAQLAIVTATQSPSLTVNRIAALVAASMAADLVRLLGELCGAC